MDQRPKLQIPTVDSLRNMVSHPKFKKEKNVARRECIEFLQRGGKVDLTCASERKERMIV